MSLDKYFGRQYHPDTYNCAHFVCEVYKDLAGTDISNVLEGFLRPVAARTAVLATLRRVTLLARPLSPCIAFMQRKVGGPHVGVWVRGKIIHLLENGSVQYQPLDVASRGFIRVRFVKC